MLGSAFSVNRGSTDAVGEGHGNFLLYNKNGEIQLPDYRQLYIDMLAKYQGFSLLLEFGNASASGLSENYTDAAAVQLIAPQQISSLLHLGNSINAQLGYVTQSGTVPTCVFLMHPEFVGIPTVCCKTPKVIH